MCGTARGRSVGSAEALFFSGEAKGIMDMEGHRPINFRSIYENFLKASRSKAVSRKRCSSVR